MINLWIGNLAKYNEGKLVGEWITLPLDEEEINTRVQAILGTDEEYFIADYESDIEALEIGMYSNIHELNNIAQELESYNDYELTIIEAIMEVDGVDVEGAIEVFNSGDYIAYEGTIEDVVYEYLNEGMISDDVINFYFESGRLARDLQMEDYEEYEEGEEPTFEDYEEQAWELLECGCINPQDYIDIDRIARDFYTEGWYEYKDISILLH